MEVSNEKLREYTRRIMIARMRVLCNNGFYGLLLMHMRMNISDEHETAWSDMKDRLFFNPHFLENVSDRELDYVLMHLLLHVALQHLERKTGYDDKYYDEAADIVVNSNILRANAGDLNSITLENYGDVQEHLVPGGDEGWKYSVEEVYQMLSVAIASKKSGNGHEKDNFGTDSDDDYEEDGFGTGSGDNHEEDGFGTGSGDNYEEDGFGTGSDNEYDGWDYHSREFMIDSGDNNLEHEIWQERIIQAVSAIQRRKSVKDIGMLPAFAERFVQKLKRPQTDWRTVLDEFIQEEINDYSFCPPDRRFDDSPFFLPDFNEKDQRVEKVLFMIDTSGSMSDDEIAQCYSEIKGAIDQFDGKLEGWLGFFDAVVVEPTPFMDENEFMAIRPKGGGGTRFDIIFNYVTEHMADDLPVSIVILTDGFAPFPKENIANGIPVLWIINNEVVKPPWGKLARISVKKGILNSSM